MSKNINRMRWASIVIASSWLLGRILEMVIDTSDMYRTNAAFFITAILGALVLFLATLPQSTSSHAALTMIGTATIVCAMVEGFFTCIELWSSIAECSRMSDTDQSIGRSCFSSNSVYRGRTCVFQSDFSPSIYKDCPEFIYSNTAATGLHALNSIVVLMVLIPCVYLAFVLVPYLLSKTEESRAYDLAVTELATMTIANTQDAAKTKQLHNLIITATSKEA